MMNEIIFTELLIWFYAILLEYSVFACLPLRYFAYFDAYAYPQSNTKLLLRKIDGFWIGWI